MTITALDAALAGVHRVLIDSSTLIAYHNPDEATHPLAHHLLARVEDVQDPLRGYYSMMTAMELLVRPIRSGEREFTFMHTFLSSYPHLTGLAMDLTVAVQAANVRALTNVRAPDAVIIASGMLAGCEAIIGNDRQWVGRLSALFTQFKWIYLGQFL